ncbi:hypothetical protein CPC08DRAFT_627706 [Agrocybe pediades]|nr:hypothetical protein CPC08DRAFT_627706 [Agrocybe pediades]
MLLSTILILFALTALFLTTVILSFRIFGCILKVARITPFKIQGFSCIAPTFVISVDTLGIEWHWPSKDSPYWMIMTAKNYVYKDSTCQVSLSRGMAKLWVLPVYFRVTAGPLIDVTLEVFAVRIATSKQPPGFVGRLRKNVIHSIFHGSTVRLHELSTKIMIGGERPIGRTKTFESNDSEALEELRVRISASQWHILTPWSHRIYSYDDLSAELRKSWTRGSGSFTLIAKECRWTKVNTFGMGKEQISGPISVLSSSLFRMMRHLPQTFCRIYADPFSMVNIHAVSCDITFCDFRLRDADLLTEMLSKAKLEYQQHNRRHPGLLESWAWGFFMGEVNSALRE